MKGKCMDVRDSDANRYEDIRRLSDNPFLNLYHMDAKDRAGHMFDYYFVSRNKEQDIKARTHSRRPEGMAVYALCKEDPGHLVMLRQFRYPLNDYMYELPAGLLEEGESAAEAAVREMKEETGLKLEVYEGGAEYFRNPFYLAQGLSDESGSMVFGYASGEIGTEGQEDSEDIVVVLVDKKEAKRILSEERVSVRGAYMLMQFLHADVKRPFAFLDEEA